MLLRLNVLLLWRRRNLTQERSSIPLQHEMGSQGVLMVAPAIWGWASIFNGTHNIRGLGSDSCVGKACLDDRASRQECGVCHHQIGQQQISQDADSTGWNHEMQEGWEIFDVERWDILQFSAAISYQNKSSGGQAVPGINPRRDC